MLKTSADLCRQLSFRNNCLLDKGIGIFLVIKADQKRVATYASVLEINTVTLPTTPSRQNLEHAKNAVVKLRGKEFVLVFIKFDVIVAISDSLFILMQS